MLVGQDGGEGRRELGDAAQRRGEAGEGEGLKGCYRLSQQRISRRRRERAAVAEHCARKLELLRSRKLREECRRQALQPFGRRVDQQLEQPLVSSLTVERVQKRGGEALPQAMRQLHHYGLVGDGGD